MEHRRSCALGWYKPSVGVPDTFKAVDKQRVVCQRVCDNAVIPIYSVQCRSLDFELPVSDSVTLRSLGLARMMRATVRASFHKRVSLGILKYARSACAS